MTPSTSFGCVLASAVMVFGGAARVARAADAPSAVPDGWFEWPYVEPEAGSPLDLRGLNRAPAGSQGRVVVRDGVFVTEDDGQRIRFWGCNLSSNEAFVDPPTAERLARRLAMGGINVARLHHLDNPWSVDSAGSLWKPGSQDRIHIDPAQLDRLHGLVAALKSAGIYSNVNLKVSRTHTEADGFPASIAQTPAFQKRVDYFSRRIIDLQKDYARQLLSVVNPYTGLSLAEDPAVAVVEINNENSLLGLRTREVGADLHLLPEPFRGELTGLWNRWLARRFASDEAIALAWARDATPTGESPLSPTCRWQADAQPGNAVAVESTDPSAVQLVIEPGGDGVRWRAGGYLDQLRFVDGSTYTLTFSARADAARTVEIAIGRDEAGWRTDKWRTCGLRATVALGPEWRTFRFVFVTHSIVDVASRLSILGGHQPGTIAVRGLRLESGSASAGLQPGQSARDGTIPIPTDPTPTQWACWLEFLSETEQAYVAEMRGYLQDELKVRAPIVCTQMNYGGIAGIPREEASDFTDAHYYWQHPDWGNPTSTWDTARYTIGNTPQIAEFGARWSGELGALALLRVTGKPFTVSEIDHPAPNEFACEMYPVLAGYAALQDWDGLYPFDSVGVGAEQDDGSIRTFFDQSHHPAKWGFSVFATRVFRRALVPPAAARRELYLGSAGWQGPKHLDVAWLREQTGQDLGFLTERLSVDGRFTHAQAHARVVRSGDAQPTALRMVQTKRGPACVIDAPAAAAIVGYVGGERVASDGVAGINGGSLCIDCDAFGINFAAITAVALDDQPLSTCDTTLVTLAARAGNKDMTWNAVRSSVGDAWGRGGAPIAERVPSTVRLRTISERRVFALEPDGSVAAEIASTWSDGWLEFSAREGPGTLHYVVQAR